MQRRAFLKGAASLSGLAVAAKLPGQALDAPAPPPPGAPLPRIPNEYTLWLPGEEASLQTTPPGNGWRALATLADGTEVYEKRVTHQGILLYRRDGRDLARIPLGVGQLQSIRPRPVKPSPARIQRPRQYVPGPD